jgi:pimeloyl-ACP methyl ester carboxylesterase
MKTTIFLLFFVAAVFASQETAAQIKDIVLVHGAFVDGSGWKKVCTILISRGYKVHVVGNPNVGIDNDLAAIQRLLDRLEGPVILVGHSYGGALITHAGNSPKVAGLVYVAAFAPEEGESLEKLLNNYPAAASQIPIAASAFTYVFETAAWKTKPSWHIIATEDRILSSRLQRFMAHRAEGRITEIKGSHVIIISRPRKVAKVIQNAVKGSAAKLAYISRYSTH